MSASRMCSVCVWGGGASVDREWWTIQKLGPKLYEWKVNGAQSAWELELNDGEWWTVLGLQWEGNDAHYTG